MGRRQLPVGVRQPFGYRGWSDGDPPVAWCNVLSLAVLTLSISGFAIHTFDPETSTEHLWGIGHMKVKVTPVNHGVQGGSDGDKITIGIGASFYRR